MECKELLTADYEFYKGKVYYYEDREAHISTVTRLAAGVMMRFVFFIMRDMGPGTVKRSGPWKSYC